MLQTLRGSADHTACHCAQHSSIQEITLGDALHVVQDRSHTSVTETRISILVEHESRLDLVISQLRVLLMYLLQILLTYISLPDALLLLII
jgi:hypothetical protein